MQKFYRKEEFEREDSYSSLRSCCRNHVVDYCVTPDHSPEGSSVLKEEFEREDSYSSLRSRCRNCLVDYRVAHDLLAVSGSAMVRAIQRVAYGLSPPGSSLYCSEREIWSMLVSPDIFLRIKPIYPIYRVTSTSFRIGAQSDVTVEIDDPDQQVWILVHLLDGTRTFSEIVQRMQEHYPTLSAEDVAEGLQTLNEEGFLEDASPCRYDLGQNDPARRYVGNVNYFSHFTRLGDVRSMVQDKLLAAKVVLLGLGGAGSNILPLLVSSGIGTIVAVDYDRVELTNLNRQFLYRESDIGLLKTQAAERIVAEMNSSIKFSTVTQKIESAEDVQPIIRDADLVICAIDEPPFLAQRRVNYACIAENVTCLYGFTQVSRGRIFSVLPRQTGCFDCLHIHYAKKDEFFEHQLRGFFESGFDAPTISFVPQISRLCGTIVDEAVRLLTNYTPPLSIATQLELDYRSGTLEPLLTWNRYAHECPTCGCGQEEQFPGATVYPGAVSLSKALVSHTHE